MKISEFSTEKAMDILCELVEPISIILSDEDLMTELRKAVDLSKAQTAAEQSVLLFSKITKIAPIVFRKRREEVCQILAILNEKTVEEIAKQNVIKTMGQIKDIVKDKELLLFFKSCTTMTGGE